MKSKVDVVLLSAVLVLTLFGAWLCPVAQINPFHSASSRSSDAPEGHNQSPQPPLPLEQTGSDRAPSIKDSKSKKTPKGHYSSYDLKQWLIYDSRTSGMFVCSHPVTQAQAGTLPRGGGAPPKGCRAWDGRSDFFVTQSLVNVEVINGHFLESFKLVTQDAQTITPYTPDV